MNLSIQDGRAELWQWDTGVRLVMDEACEAVNISTSTFGVTVDVTTAEDGKTWVAAVPDEMLQKPGDLICYAVQSTATGTITAAYRSFRVNRRPKPAGYVATPTEARTWQELDDKKIDAPQIAQVGEVLSVEEVNEDGKPTKWETAKVSGTFVCTFNEGEDGWITCDKTVEEIITANNDGKDVIGHYYGDIYRLSTPLETGGGYGNPIFSNLGIGVLSIIQYDNGHFGFNSIRLSDIAPEDIPDPYEVPVYVPTKYGMRWQYSRPLLATDYLMNELTDEEKALMQKNLGIKVISPIPSPTTAQVGQIVKVKAVDADGKVTETETVDMPMQKTLKWITVHSSDLTEETTEIVVSADPTGKAIADYNPVGLTLIISTPADATQTDNNGTPWVYPSATKKYNSIRVIGSISGWKTTARDSVFAFYGGSSAMTCTGNVNNQLATYKIDGYALDGVTAMLNGNTNHFPVGTHVEVSILCEV